MIKGLCTVSTGSVVNLLIDGEMPKVGHYYYLESATEGTTAQNKTFHALTMEYFNSGQSSYDAANYADFKNQIKRHLGAGFEGFVYIEITEHKDIVFKEVEIILENGDKLSEEIEIENITYTSKMKDAKKIEDIPKKIRHDECMKDLIRGKLKSWSCYSKNQRKETIDNVISEMHQAGINTPKFEEILKGFKSET